MTIQTTKVRNGNIALPEEIRKNWKEADVFVRASDDTLVIKKIQNVAFWDTWRRLRKVGKKFTRIDIDRAISWARKK